MSLPPLGSGFGSGRDEKDDGRSPRVKALPLVLSSTGRSTPGPTLTAQGRGVGSPGGYGSRPGTSAYGSQGMEPPGSPASPGSPAYRNKFTRIKGIQPNGMGGGPGGPLVMEGSSTFGPRPSTVPAAATAADPYMQHVPMDAAPHYAWGPGQQPHHGGEHGGGGGALASHRSSGLVGGASGSNMGGPSTVNLTLPMEPPPPLYAPIPQVLQAAGLGGGGGGGAWATKRSSLARSTSRSKAPGEGGPALEGHGLGPGGQSSAARHAPAPGALLGVPGAPLRVAQQPAADPWVTPGPEAAAINPPLYRAHAGDFVGAGEGVQAQPSAQPQGAGGQGGGMGLPDPAAAADAVGGGEGEGEGEQQGPDTYMQQQQQYLQQQQQQAPFHISDATPAQLLQRFHRSNLTPNPPPLAFSPPPAALPPPSLAARPSGSPQQPLSSSPLPPAPPGQGPSPTPPPQPTSAWQQPSAPSTRPGTTASTRPRTRGATGTQLADLSSAVQKSIAAGMGEWDLQMTGAWWSSPEMQERMLRGPLGPEVLKHRYRMEDRDILALYRLLYSYSVGFFTDVQQLVDAAVVQRGGAPPELRQELLEAVFRTYAQLWDEALMIVFDSEMTSCMADKTAALEALDAAVVEVEALKLENEQLQTRLADFVKQNIDNMLATRHMQQNTSQLEGELLTLSSANEQLVAHMAGHAVSVSQLERQLAAAREAQQAAEARAAAAEAHMANLKGTLSEQNATLGAQFFQIQELNAMVAELQEAARHNTRRRTNIMGTSFSHAHPPTFDPSGPSRPVSAAHGSLPDIPVPAAAAAAAAGADDDEIEELELALADRTRAFNLLHADFVVKKHELEEARKLEAQLRDEIKSLEQAARSADERSDASRKQGERFKRRWEEGRMLMEDLEATNRRLNTKNADLVRSYWPLMTRLREAEAEAAAAREAATAAEAAAAVDRAAVEGMKAEAEAARAKEALLQELQAEVESHELEIPPDLLLLLSDGQAASLRRFARGCHRRVAHLNTTVVQLMEQVQALKQQQQQQDGVLGVAGAPLAAAGSQAAGAAGGGSSAPPEAPTSPAAAPGRGFARMSGGGAAPPAPATAATAAPPAAAPADAALVAELRAAVAQRDKWLYALNRIMTQLIGQMENLMLRDWETCSALRLQQQARKEQKQAARVAEQGGGAPSAAEAGASEGEAGAVQEGPKAEGSQREGAAEEGAEGDEGPTGRASREASRDGSRDGAEGERDGEHEEAQREPEGRGQQEAQDSYLVVASGRLAQAVGAGVERTPVLVSLDSGWERLVDSAERLVEWADGLLRRKEQTANHAQMKQRLDAALRQVEAANAELVALRPAKEALRQQLAAMDVRYKTAAAHVASATQRATSAESRLASTEAQLATVQERLDQAQAAYTRLEQEYWKAKSVALEAEVATGELRAGRTRAQEQAAAAVASISGLEREARENREMRVALEADLVGYKAWVRHMTQVEKKYMEVLRELAAAQSGLEQRDREVAQLTNSLSAVQQQLRLKSIEAGGLEARTRSLSRELEEERRSATAAAEAARTTAATQLAAAARQADTLEAAAATAAARVQDLEARLAEAARGRAAAEERSALAGQALAATAAERDRLRAHVAASRPLLEAMERAAAGISRRLAVLEDAAGSQGACGSLDLGVSGLLDCADRALDAFDAVARSAAGDGVPAALGALEGLVAQLLAALSKGGKEPLQSITVLKTQLARDDKEIAALRDTMARLQAAAEQASAAAAAERASAAQAASKAGGLATRAQDAERRAAAGEAAARQARAEAEAAKSACAAATKAAEEARQQMGRLQRRAVELEADVTSVRTQCRNLDAQMNAASAQRTELQRRATELEMQAGRDRDALREAQGRMEALQTTAAAATAKGGELEAALEASRKDVERLSAEAKAAVATAEEHRSKAVVLEQEMLAMQAKHADMLRHDESMEEKLRQATFEVQQAHKRMADVMQDAADTEARWQALQQRAWELQVALQQQHGEKEAALQTLVETGALQSKVHEG